MNSPIAQSDRTAALAELKRLIQMPLPPVPQNALDDLYDVACQDTGGSQAVRSFLFWLAGSRDPTGHESSGGLELRRLDHQLKKDCLEVLAWWSGPTRSDEPLYAVLRKLRERFEPR